MPTTMPTFAMNAIAEMLEILPKQPSRELLERCGVALADAFRGHLHVAVFEYLNRDVMHAMSDDQALGVLRLLGERYAAPDKGWTGALRSALVVLQSKELSPHALGEALAPTAPQPLFSYSSSQGHPLVASVPRNLDGPRLIHRNPEALQAGV